MQVVQVMTDEIEITELDWEVRAFVYRFFIENQRPPTDTETAEQFNLDQEAAQEAYLRLHQRHQFFLQPGTRQILIANPLSATPTPYQVMIQGQKLWATCAWDSLGIPAMCQADALIEARDVLSGETIHYHIRNGQLESPNYVVHFSLAARHWYDDLVHT